MIRKIHVEKLFFIEKKKKEIISYKQFLFFFKRILEEKLGLLENPGRFGLP